MNFYKDHGEPYAATHEVDRTIQGISTFIDSGGVDYAYLFNKDTGLWHVWKRNYYLPVDERITTDFTLTNEAIN